MKDHHIIHINRDPDIPIPVRGGQMSHVSQFIEKRKLSKLIKTSPINFIIFITFFALAIFCIYHGGQ